MAPEARGPHGRIAVGAVLLAAGAGERIGRRPKCLLELGGVPLIRRQLLALTDAGVDEVVLVLGHHADAIEPLVQDIRVTRVRNPEPGAGPVSSQRVGLAALGGRLDAVIVALADQPLLGAADHAALIGAWMRRPEPGATRVVVPWVDGERGNPVILAAEVREAILAGGADLGCRQWQQAHPDAVHRFETDNRNYRVDIDTEDDRERFERETGHALRWPAAWAAETDRGPG